ncbi:hypothetical protein U5N28_14155 [Lysinibacillus telephonicus]|uniref:Endolytic transglycosylase MltG n=1 Tax=Lysinibacillus telephonicus TaxID=1714840 RepID=A0A431UIH6_9BACI|nr:hypothetical protein [Lysinibacillus telephonicus]RTQ89517.1 hypothetical protein EKG35_16280 [Lysinibacillus telephonicus]
MKRSSVRAFGIACFLIGALLTVSNLFHIPLGLSNDSDKSIKQYEEKITNLELQLKEAEEKIKSLELNTQTKEIQAASSENKSESSNEENQTNQSTAIEEQPAEDIVTGTLYIYSGLTPAEVAKKIKDLGVINNSVEMELFLAQPEYARSLQTGQYNLNSSMTIEEIANMITGKKTE